MSQARHVRHSGSEFSLQWMLLDRQYPHSLDSEEGAIRKDLIPRLAISSIHLDRLYGFSLIYLAREI